jgi:site-specific DNA-methyltransferase (adenine-specific)
MINQDLINKITLADCMDIIKDFPDKSIDLAIVDPPYGIGDFRVGCGKAKTGKAKYKKIEWNNKIPTKKYFSELYRISKHQIIFGFQYYMEHIKAKGIIVHNKKIPFVMNLSMGDIASCSLQNRVTIFEYEWHGFIQGNMKEKQKRIHPCEKPIALYRWLLQNYAKPGQIILDTHSGSGSLAVACYLEKFDFIAIEKDADYHRDSVNRLETVKSQGLLF